MRIEKKYRHSVEKKNAPYRGVSEQGDFVNATLEVLHDLLEIAIASGDKGHAKEIRERMQVLVAGGQGDFRTSMHQVGRICTLERIEIPEDLTEWSVVGGATVSATATGYTITETGLLDPAGIIWNVDVNPGDELMMFLKVRGISGKTDEVLFGASHINLGNEVLKKVNTGIDSSGVYVDNRLYCQERETVEIGVFLHRVPTNLEAGSIEVMEVSLWRVRGADISMKGLETESKTEMMRIRDTIESVRK